jgi:glutamate racemase
MVTGAAPRSSQAIGIFDSGIGGLTVAKAIGEVLPDEVLIYLGDTGRTPYGTKSEDVVRRYSRDNAMFLVDKGIKLLVVACNTASAVALTSLRSEVDIPVIGVIEPGAAAAAAATRRRKVGIIGTEATIRSGAYTRALQGLREDLEIYTRACPLFVPLAEEGWVDNEVARTTAQLYLASLRNSGIDTLVLGCTHYPLLRTTIAEVMGAGVGLIDSAAATAGAVRDTLREAGLAATEPGAGNSFFVTDSPERFVRVGARFLGAQVDSAVQIER